MRNDTIGLVEPLATKVGLQRFYRGQLWKFERIGMGNKTEFNVIVTETLMDATRRRLSELYE